MPDIKTRDVVSGTIKAVDRSAMAGQRMKDVYVKAKDKTEHSVYSSESNSEEYAADRITDSASDVAREAVHQIDVQGQRIIQGVRQSDEPSKTMPDAHPHQENQHHFSNVPQQNNTPNAQQSHRVTPDGTVSHDSGGHSAPITAKQEAVRNQQIKTAKSELKAKRASRYAASPVPQAPSTVSAPTAQAVNRAEGVSAKSAGKLTVKIPERTIKKAGSTVKTVEHMGGTAIKSTQAAAEAAQKTAVIAAQTAHRSQIAAKAAAAIAKKTAEYTARAAKAIAQAMQELISVVAAGGGTVLILVIVLIVMCFAGMMLASDENDTEILPVSDEVKAYEPIIQKKEQADLDAAAAIPTTATEQPPVLPIILSSEKPANKMKEITDRLEQGILGIYESDRYADYLRTMSKFHDYSLNNTILIAMQGGNLVKGYKQWEKEFDRHVKPGEKAIKIIAPAPFTVKKQVEKIDPDTQKPVFDKNGKAVTEEKEIQIPAFRVVSVFDVSQTEGKELPDLGIKELTGDVEQYQDFFAALEKTSPFAMGFEALSGSIKGRCNYEEKCILINEGMDELQNIKTAIHEIAHATLHDIDKDAPERPDRRTREVQAESVAYAVCQHYGLDTSDYSFGYIAGWSSGKELAELKGSLETIRSTAASLIDTIDGHFAEIQKAQDKEQTTEQAQTPQEATIQPEAEAAAPELPEETAPVQEKEAQTEPEADTGASSEAPQPEQAAPAAPYYTINEAAAKRAKDANSLGSLVTPAAFNAFAAASWSIRLLSCFARYVSLSFALRYAS